MRRTTTNAAAPVLLGDWAQGWGFEGSMVQAEYHF